MRARRCIGERPRPWEPGVTTWIWHILPTGWNEPEAGFAPILCSDDEGITLPGHSETREPTCPDCIAIASGVA